MTIIYQIHAISVALIAISLERERRTKKKSGKEKAAASPIQQDLMSQPVEVKALQALPEMPCVETAFPAAEAEGESIKLAREWLGSERDTWRESNADPEMPLLDDQSFLLSTSDVEESHKEEHTQGDIQNAVLFSSEVWKRYGPSLFPQFGLLGSSYPVKETQARPNGDSRIFLNTNIPFSAFICGLQGSGKSHTMSCLLENCLIQTTSLGALQKPLSATVFHFGGYSSPLSFRVCEAAYLACPYRQYPDHPSTASATILAALSNYNNLAALYTRIPGVKVHPFKLRPRDLTISSMLTLMSVDQSQSVPLYMNRVTKILRDMAATSAEAFDYLQFKRLIRSCKFSSMQRRPLEQRLELLESFLTLDHSSAGYEFKKGSITIFDLSCPFVDANTACALFDICLGMYLEADSRASKIIAVDEAHNFMVDMPASKALSESLLKVIRQQRHYGVRVIISTQEPTISPRLMDLCSLTIIHRFSSPEWSNVLRRHVTIFSNENGAEDVFRRIANLRIGEALLFAPSTLLSQGEGKESLKLNLEFLAIKIRKRLTFDGGKSVVCL